MLTKTKKLFESLTKDGATKKEAVKIIEAVINVYERIGLIGIKGIIEDFKKGK